MVRTNIFSSQLEYSAPVCELFVVAHGSVLCDSFTGSGDTIDDGVESDWGSF